MQPGRQNKRHVIWIEEGKVNTHTHTHALATSKKDMPSQFKETPFYRNLSDYLQGVGLRHKF